MPPKTKKASSSSEEKVVVKSAMKKSPAKKVTSKKSVAKKSTAKKVAPVMQVNVEEQVVPVVTVIEKEIQTSHGPVEVHHKYVFIGTCRNCDHMPMGVNKLVGVLSIAILILSGMLVSTALPYDFRLPSISMGSFTDWMIPDSQLNNL